jgi:hypothetical protein
VTPTGTNYPSHAVNDPKKEDAPYNSENNSKTDDEDDNKPILERKREKKGKKRQSGCMQKW